MAKTITQPQVQLLFFFLLLLISTYISVLNVKALREYPPTSKNSTMQVLSKQSTTITTTATIVNATTVAAATRNSSQQFRVVAHNVPSGPNPESNR